MIQLREKLSKNGLLALRALHDCKVVRAMWSNPGYEELSIGGLVDRKNRLGSFYDYTLNDDGKTIAARKFGA